MRIRYARKSDVAGIHDTVRAALGTVQAAEVATVLRDTAGPLVSLIAEEDGRIVGHILLSKVSLLGRPERKLMGLGSVTVAPGYRRQGIGSALVKSGLEECRRLGTGAVVVSGDPAYYARFGFVPAARFRVDGEMGAPDGVFLARELTTGYLDDTAGTINCHAAPGAVSGGQDGEPGGASGTGWRWRKGGRTGTDAAQ